MNKQTNARPRARLARRLAACWLAGALALSATGCQKAAGNGGALDPKKPVTVTVWNYYNGNQLTAFDQMVKEFNATAGAEQGVTVVSASQGDVDTLADALIAAVDGEAGAQEVPTLASVYAETGYILNEKSALVPLDPYFTTEELDAYVPGFLDEGRFGAGDGLMLFPVTKSTEVFCANATDWAPFAAATGITLESIETQEDLTAAAAAYYRWTDAQTATPEDGKALYGRDSLGNYLFVGSCQLGHELFKTENGKTTADLDRATFKTLWDNYYIPTINGYFGAYAKFRSEDAKTGKILSLTASSTSTSYLPAAVTLPDDTTYPIEMTLRGALPFAGAVQDAVVQQGAGYCLLKSTEAQQAGAVAFLKWFTDPARNLNFALRSSYSPVTKAANNEETITEAYQAGEGGGESKNVLASLLLSAEAFTQKSPYASRPFAGSKEVRTILDDSMDELAAADRVAVVQAIAGGATRAAATAPYLTDDYFDAWFEELCRQVKAAMGHGNSE